MSVAPSGALPSDLARRHSPDLLCGQFLLGDVNVSCPSHWRRYTLVEVPWTIAAEPRLPIVPFTCDASPWRGWVLGFPLDPLNAERDLIDAIARCGQEPNPFDALERLLHGLSGRFAVAALAPSGERFYLDACGYLAAVFCPSRRLLASTVNLIPYDEQTGDDQEMIEAVNVAGTNGFFAFGATPRHGVFRLLPNHYLDLGAFSPLRHWPTNDAKDTMSTGAAVQAISRLVHGAVSAVCARDVPYLSLTAGRDSRALLAISKDLRDKARFFTWAIPDTMAQQDVSLSRELAQLAGVRHEVIQPRPFSTADLDRWLYRTGSSVGEQRGMRLSPTVQSMDCDRPYLPGLANEVGRAFYWRPGDEQRTFTGEDLVKRLGLKPHPTHVAAADRWLAGVPYRHPYDILDLVYIEQRLGCWAGPAAYALDFVFRFPPFANRTIFQTMLALPFQYRLDQQLVQDIIQMNWPELLAFPFNPKPASAAKPAPPPPSPAQAAAPRALRGALRRLLSRTPVLWRLVR